MPESPETENACLHPSVGAMTRHGDPSRFQYVNYLYIPLILYVTLSINTYFDLTFPQTTRAIALLEGGGAALETEDGRLDSSKLASGRDGNYGCRVLASGRIHQ